MQRHRTLSDIELRRAIAEIGNGCNLRDVVVGPYFRATGATTQKRRAHARMRHHAINHQTHVWGSLVQTASTFQAQTPPRFYHTTRALKVLVLWLDPQTSMRQDRPCYITNRPMMSVSMIYSQSSSLTDRSSLDTCSLFDAAAKHGIKRR